jgi:hypothetical protein
MGLETPSLGEHCGDDSLQQFDLECHIPKCPNCGYAFHKVICVAMGTRRLKAYFSYYSCLLVDKIVSINIYDAILIISRKNSVSAWQRRAA